MSASVLGREHQINQCSDRPVGAQHRIGQLEQHIRPGGQAALQLIPKPRQDTGSPGHIHHNGYNEHRSGTGLGLSLRQYPKVKNRL